MDRDIKRTFIKYVALNVLGMAGLSCYILADTFFIARAMGAEGLAALNFSISIYSIIHGIGLMVGIGGATRFCILKARCRHKRADIAFAESFRLGLSAGTILAGIGLFASYQLASMLGADSSTLPMTTTYLRTILCFAPFFISNNILIAFARNDSAPRLSMAAMLAGSLSKYFIGFFFAGINVTAAMFFSACENSGFAFIISIARGCIVIVPLLIVLSRLTGMTGVWLSFVITEFFVTLVALYMAGSKKRYLSH